MTNKTENSFLKVYVLRQAEITDKTGFVEVVDKTGRTYLDGPIALGPLLTCAHADAFEPIGARHYAHSTHHRSFTK